MAKSEPRTSAAHTSVEALSDLVVLEIAGSPGACFAASLLADFGARVHVCETPPAGSRIRMLDPPEWWAILARNKTSIAVDPGAPEGSELVRRLFSMATMVVTDVAPPDRAGHPWLRELARVEKKPLMVDVFPTGADRPELWQWSRRADMTSAVTGMMALTGNRDQTPVQPEFPLAEYLSGTLAALRAVAEMRRSRLAGGPTIDVQVALHMAVQRMIEWQVPIATVMGRPELRDGNMFPMSYSVSNMFRTKENKYLAISAANQASAIRLMEMVGGPELSSDPRFATVEARVKGGLSELYAIIGRWTETRTLADIREIAKRHDVVLGPVFDADDIVVDEQIKARANIAKIPAADGGIVPMPSIIPTVVGWNNVIRNAGPDLGADTESVLAAFGVSAEAIERLRKSATIGV